VTATALQVPGDARGLLPDLMLPSIREIRCPSRPEARPSERHRRRVARLAPFLSDTLINKA